MSPTNSTERPKPCWLSAGDISADIMKDIDLLLTPSALGEAPAGLASTGDTSFNILSTWTYTPCVTLPVFTGPSGLPVGIQLIGYLKQDHRLLEGAQAVYRVFATST
jgi:Asp-tRNA(Asn)/Glu-tRNA(Gln) amidotransferase A subunit family amidase